MSTQLSNFPPVTAERFQPDIKPELTATAPGQLRVIRRNGSVATYDDSKITIAMTKAFLAVEGGNAAASTRVRQLVTELTQQVTQALKRHWPSGGTLHIEAIQDQVELALMRAGEHKVARSYVLYREERRRAREQQQAAVAVAPRSDGIRILLEDGNLIPLDKGQLQFR